jgi:hypothetical protein
MDADTVNESVAEFTLSLRAAIQEMRGKWRSLDTLDISKIMIAVLPLRNFDLFEAFAILLKHHSVPVAEMVLRPLLEGTVILEWCALDLPKRGLRFRYTSLQSTLDLVDSGFLQRDDEYTANIRDSISWFESNGYKQLPDMRTMLDEIEDFRPGAGYRLYQLLSKSLHARMEDWHDYADAEGRASVTETDWSRTSRFLQARAISAYLTLRNVLLLAQILPAVAPKALSQLEAAWGDLYEKLELHRSR